MGSRSPSGMIRFCSLRDGILAAAFVTGIISVAFSLFTSGLRGAVFFTMGGGGAVVFVAARARVVLVVVGTAVEVTLARLEVRVGGTVFDAMGVHFRGSPGCLQALSCLKGQEHEPVMHVTNASTRRRLIKFVHAELALQGSNLVSDGCTAAAANLGLCKDTYQWCIVVY